MILLNAASKVSVMLLANPQSKNKLAIKAKGRMGVSILDVDLDIIVLLFNVILDRKTCIESGNLCKS